MMSLEEAITIFCERLRGCSIPYVIGGSLASGIWGEPRQTHDVDVEVWITRTWNHGSLKHLVLGDHRFL